MNHNDEEEQAPIQIPASELSPEALQGLIESFILREGTDYGVQEAAFETKFKQIKSQLDRGEVIIAFDPNTETVGIFTKTQWSKLRPN